MHSLCIGLMERVETLLLIYGLFTWVIERGWQRLEHAVNDGIDVHCKHFVKVTDRWVKYNSEWCLIDVEHMLCENGYHATFKCVNHRHVVVREVCDLESLLFLPIHRSSIGLPACHFMYFDVENRECVLDGKHAELADCQECDRPIQLLRKAAISLDRLGPLQLLCVTSGVIAHLNFLRLPKARVPEANCIELTPTLLFSAAWHDLGQWRIWHVVSEANLQPISVRHLLLRCYHV